MVELHLRMTLQSALALFLSARDIDGQTMIDKIADLSDTRSKLVIKRK